MTPNQQKQPAGHTRNRIGPLLRENKLFIVLELCLALLVIAAYLADFLPLSETPFLFLLGWISLRLRGIGWRGVGLKRPARWGQTITIGVVTGVVFQFLVTYAIEPLIVRLTGNPVDLSQFAALRSNLFLLAFMFVLVWTLAAFGEEFVYRGYLMNRVADLFGGSTTGWIVSLVLVSVLFGVGHLYQGTSGILVNAIAGLVYGVVYLKTGRNLWAAIITHGVYDTVGLAFIYLGY